MIQVQPKLSSINTLNNSTNNKTALDQYDPALLVKS